MPVFCSLNLCLEVCLLGTAWFGTHPLLLQIFVGYEPGSSWYLSFFSFPRHLVEGCEVAACHLSELSYSSLWFCFYLKDNFILDSYFISILIFTLEACARDNLVLGIELIWLGFIIEIVVELSLLPHFVRYLVLGWLVLVG